MWDLVNEMWPVEARPKLLQSRRVVEKMTIAEISQFKAHYEQEEEKKGGEAAVFGKDKKLRAVEFKKGKDNGTSKLHEARFELRMPFCMPKKYWHRLPPKREVFRHFPLSHLGMEGQVSETTVVRMHDRRVPVTLDMLCKGNAGKDLKVDKADWVEPTEVRHLQEAVLKLYSAPERVVAAGLRRVGDHQGPGGVQLGGCGRRQREGEGGVGEKVL